MPAPKKTTAKKAPAKKAPAKKKLPTMKKNCSVDTMTRDGSNLILTLDTKQTVTLSKAELLALDKVRERMRG